MKALCIITTLAFFLTGCGGGSVTPAPTAERINISGSGSLGIFDPSLAKDPATNRLWMSYSSVNQSSYYAATEYWNVSIRLAYSDDNGVSWTDQGSIVADYTETLVGPLRAPLKIQKMGGFSIPKIFSERPKYC